MSRTHTPFLVASAILFMLCIPLVSVHAQIPGFESGSTTTEGFPPQQTQEEQNNPPPSIAGDSIPLLRNPSIPYRESRLGRAAVLSIGVFPFSYFYTGLVMDIARFSASNFDPSYAPWPFRTQNSIAYTNFEMWIKLGVSAAVSILFGTLSALLK